MVSLIYVSSMNFFCNENPVDFAFVNKKFTQSSKEQLNETSLGNQLAVMLAFIQVFIEFAGKQSSE